MTTARALSGSGIALLFAAGLIAAGPAAKAPDYKAVAEKLVENAGVKEKDRVVVTGDVRDIDLLEEVSLAVFKRGAEAIQRVTREKMAKRFYAEVPEKYDGIPRDFEMELAKAATVEISVGGTEFPGLLKDVPSARLEANARSMQPVFELKLKRSIRQLNLGNGLYPTDATAKQFGMTKDQLARTFWDGVNVDYAKLQANGETIRALFAAGKEVKVTNPNGTDLTVQVAARPVFVSDGVISAEDVAKGGPATQVWLPAGEVYVTVVPGTAEGKVVVDRLPYADGEIAGLTLTFKAGKLVSHTAKAGATYDLFKKRYEAGGAGKDEFSVIDVGINPNVKIAAGTRLLSWVSSGMVALGIGGNEWAGGTNTAAFGMAGFLPGSTLTIDGKPLVEKGVLKVAGGS